MYKVYLKTQKTKKIVFVPPCHNSIIFFFNYMRLHFIGVFHLLRVLLFLNWLPSYPKKLGQILLQSVYIDIGFVERKTCIFSYV